MNRLFLLLFGMVTFVAHAQVPDYVPTEGLVGWWPLDGTISDAFSSNYSGAAYGAEFVEDRFGNIGSALLLDGIDDYAQIEGETAINSFTISIWYKIDDPTFTGYGSLVHIGRDNGVPYCNGFGTGATGTPLELSAHFSCRGYVSPGLPDNSAILNEWTHWVVVYTSIEQSFSFYRNGVHLSTVVSPFSESFVSPDPFIYLGCTEPGTVGRFKGNLDDLGLFNRALSEEEITALYNAAAPATVSGCTDPTACNYDAEATSDDGSCTYPPFGLADCEAGGALCGEGTIWDASLQACVGFNDCPSDLDDDGLIGVSDLLLLLADFGTLCPEPWACGDPVSYQGYDYATVQIGGQCWFAENLKSEHYRNGDEIPMIYENNEWLETTVGALCWHNNDSTSWGFPGFLYNGFAVEDVRGLCPSDWHVATDEDWIEVEVSHGLSLIEAQEFGQRGANINLSQKMRDESWGENEMGFAARRGGYRAWENGTFSGVHSGAFWSSSETAPGYREFYIQWSGVARGDIGMSEGLSVRCLKDQ